MGTLSQVTVGKATDQNWSNRILFMFRLFRYNVVDGVCRGLFISL
jgi:hypothetical protein